MIFELDENLPRRFARSLHALFDVDGYEFLHALDIVKPGTPDLELFAVLAERGLRFVDAPVTGGQAGAENGTLSALCGGSAKAIEAARPVMQAYTGRITHIGKAGAGQSTKMVNQICIAGILAGLS